MIDKYTLAWGRRRLKNMQRLINEARVDDVKALKLSAAQLYADAAYMNSMGAEGEGQYLALLATRLEMIAKHGVAKPARKIRKQHSRDGRVRCPICAPLRCSKAK